MTHPRAHSHTITQPLCKGVRKDGSPCQAEAHRDLDGYCVAHGPADKLRVWRVNRGSSATASRIDRRVPERFKEIIELLTEGMTAVRQGHLSPSAYNAICNGAKELRAYYKLADEEMEEIRAEEDRAAAAAMAGGHGDLNILNTSAAISEEENRYSLESFAAQGLAELEEPSDPDEPATAVLTEEGRQRFGIRPQSSYTQEDLDNLRNDALQYRFRKEDLPYLIEMAKEMREEMEAARTALTSGAEDAPEPLRDPLTGQPMDRLPARTRTGVVPETGEVETDPEVLADQVRQAGDLIRLLENLYQNDDYERTQDELNDPDAPNGAVINHQPVPTS